MFLLGTLHIETHHFQLIPLQREGGREGGGGERGREREGGGGGGGGGGEREGEREGEGEREREREGGREGERGGERGRDVHSTRRPSSLTRRARLPRPLSYLARSHLPTAPLAVRT